MSLREQLERALAASQTDKELAAQVVASGALSAVLDAATVTQGEAALILGYRAESMRSITSRAARGTSSFPRPVVDGRRFATHAIEDYAESRPRREG